MICEKMEGKQIPLRKQSEEKIENVTGKEQLVGRQIEITNVLESIPTDNGEVNVYTGTLSDGKIISFFGSSVMDKQGVTAGTKVVVGSGQAAKGRFYKFYLPE